MMPIKSNKIKLIILSLFAFLLIFVSTWWLIPTLHYNIRTVINGQVYRSAELPKNELADIVENKDIKTIINLRNAHPKEQWYRDEVAISKAHGIHLYNVSLPAFGLPTREQLIHLTEIIEKAKPPILIHCRHGSDRTGLASAIVLIMRNNPSIHTIEKQVSWHYLALNPKSVGKLVLPQYAKWLSSLELPSNSKHFVNWVDTRYKKTR